MAIHHAAALSSPPTPHWTAAHEALSRLARQRAALDAEEGRWLLLALRAEAHAHLGFGSFCEYVERLFGYKPRTTQEKLRVAEALEGLPRLATALASGTLGWCAARELTRVAVPETEQAWLEAARGKTQRELEALVSDKSPGDAPDAPGAGIPRRHVLRFEVSADTLATFRDAVRHLQRATGGRMDHDALLLTMARHILGGPSDDGRSSYQVSLHVCAACGGGAQVASGELVPVDPAVVEMAECDAQHLDAVPPGAVAQRAANENANAAANARRNVDTDDPDEVNAVVAAEAVAAVGESAAGRCSSHAHGGAWAECEAQRLDEALPPARAQRAANENAEPPAAKAARSLDTDDLDEVNAVDAVGESTAGHCLSHVHVDARTTPAENDARRTATAPASPSTSDVTPRARVHPFPRARQSIPPALRRAVLDRDHRRCQVPGCTHATYVDVHHLRRLADGGLNVLWNLLALCSAHHRATHRGELLIERGADGALVFRHADGSLYGHPVSPPRVDVQTKVFSALMHLGFREREVKAVLDALRADAALADATAERLLREALCRIQPMAR